MRGSGEEGIGWEGREVGQAEGEDAGEVVTEPPLPLDYLSYPTFSPARLAVSPALL